MTATKLLTTSALARRLQVSAETLSRWRHLGLPRLKVAGKVLYELERVLAWMRAREAEIDPTKQNGGRSGRAR